MKLKLKFIHESNSRVIEDIDSESLISLFETEGFEYDSFDIILEFDNEEFELSKVRTSRHILNHLNEFDSDVIEQLHNILPKDCPVFFYQFDYSINDYYKRLIENGFAAIEGICINDTIMRYKGILSKLINANVFQTGTTSGANYYHRDGTIENNKSVKEMSIKYGLNEAGFYSLFYGSDTYKDWALSRYNLTKGYKKEIHRFHNRVSGTYYTGSQKDFSLEFGLLQSSVSKLVTGRLKSHKDWVLL